MSSCLKTVQDIGDSTSVYQEFMFPKELKPVNYMIMECFENIYFQDAVEAKWGVDYSLFYYVNRPKGSNTMELFDVLKEGNFTNEELIEHYNKPLKEFGLEHQGSNNVILNILYYQLVFLIYNFSKSYPASFEKSSKNTQSTINAFLKTKGNSINWSNISDIFAVSENSSGFFAFHNKSGLKQLYEMSKTSDSDLDTDLDRARAYVKILGLYFSYQVHKKNEANVKANVPLFPPRIADKFKFSDKFKTVDSYQVDKKLNTFEIPDKDLEIQVTKLSDLSPDEKYQPESNLINQAQLENYLDDDQFILDLISSELKLMHYKIDNYHKLLAEIDQTLSDPNVDAKVKKSLESKKTIINIVAANITKRIGELTNDSIAQSDRVAQKREAIADILESEDGILSIKGGARENIRKYLYSQIYIFSKAPELYTKNFMNYTIMGPAGSGKTKLASVLAYVYNHLGILASDKFMVVTRADLVAGYIGQTAPKTRDYLQKSLEGVLLVDEAYQLSGCPDEKGNWSSKDYGQEAVTEIVNFIDKHIGLSVIIAAGYEKQIMTCFLAINEGMKRRFPNNLRLLPYSADDLYIILMGFLTQKFNKDLFSKDQKKYIRQLITALNDMTYEGDKLFNNQAGDMLNLGSILAEDLILEKPNYTRQKILLSFQKFFSNKGYFLEL